MRTKGSFPGVSFPGLLLCSVVLLAPPGSPGEPPDRRAPVPSAAEQKAAERKVRDSFKADYEARGVEAAQRLAEKLLQASREATRSPAERFVLLRDSRDVSLKCGELKAALSAVDSMASAFAVDAGAAKESLLGDALKAARNPAEAKAVAGCSLAILAEIAGADDLDGAKKVLTLIEAAARRTQDAGLAAGVPELRADLAELSKMAKDLKEARWLLSINENDPAANLKVGRYLSFLKGDWAKGLAHLARGSDPILLKLATEDLSAPGTAGAQEALGNAWMQAARKSPGREGFSLRLRGARWLAQACRQKDGPDRAKLLQGLESFGEDISFPRLAWLGADAPAGFVVARYNGLDLRGWESAQTTWKFKGQIASDEPDLGNVKDKFLRSALAARWIRLTYEFQGVTGLWFTPGDAAGPSGSGLNLDKEGRHNEIRRDIAPERFHTLVVDFHGDDARVLLDGEPVDRRFSVGGPTHVVIKAARGPLRVRKLKAVGFNP